MPLRVVVTDANLLFSRVVRDYLLYAGSEGIIDVKWDQEILDEMARNLHSARGFSTLQVERLISNMNQAYPAALVHPTQGDYDVFADLAMPDPSDRHVVAAAVACDADVICTDNLKDFPCTVMKRVGVGLMSADELLGRLVLESPNRMSNVHRSTMAALKEATDETILSGLSRAGCEATSHAMKNVLAGKVYVHDHIRDGHSVRSYWRSRSRRTG